MKRKIYIDAILRQDAIYLTALIALRREGISDEEKSRIADIYLETAIDHAIGLDPSDISKESIASFYKNVFNSGEEEVLRMFIEAILDDPERVGFSKSGLEKKFGSKIERFFEMDTRTESSGN